MDFLNKYLAQLKELLEGMTPGARITSALLLLVAAVSMGYLFTSGFHHGGEIYLLDNRSFSSDELTAMEAAFASEGVSAYEIVGGRIRVPRGQQSVYVAALAKNGALPRDFGTILDGALKSSSAFEDQTKFQARLKNDKQKYLAEVFRSMKGIERAAVLYDEEIKPGLRKERVVTASVSVKPIGVQPLDEFQINAICQTMVGAVAGLKSENVVVMDLNSGRSHSGASHDGLGGPGGLLAQEQRKQEQNWRQKIESLLSYVPGVIVTPNVELTPERVHRTRSTTIDKENTVPIQVIESKTTREQRGEPRGGRPGYVANVQGNTARSIAGSEARGSEETEKVSELNETSLPSGEQTEKEFAPHTVQRVAVAIAVPTSHFTRVWRNQNPTPPGEDPKDPAPADIERIRTEETAKIKQVVAGILPATGGVADPAQLVQVTDFEDILPAPISGPGIAETAATWLGMNWSTLGLILLGLASLLMLRSMIRSALPGEAAGQPGLAAMPDSERAEEAEEEEEPGHLQRFSGTGKSLRDELSTLVASDPETAANILRNWIGNPVK